MNDQAVLSDLNQRYVESYATGNTAFFDRILASDFRETSPDGTILNRVEFLSKIEGKAQESSSSIEIEADDVEVRIFGDTAIVHARSVVTLPDRSTITGGRYTDIYSRIDGEWLCVAAHLGGVP
jgi:hypothetical protein